MTNDEMKAMDGTTGSEQVMVIRREIFLEWQFAQAVDDGYFGKRVPAWKPTHTKTWTWQYRYSTGSHCMALFHSNEKLEEIS